MIIPVSADKIATMSREELVKAYEDIGFDRETAEAYTSVLGKDEPVEKMTVTVKHARDVADQIDDAEFTKAVEAAEAMELSTVVVERSLDTDTISLRQPSGVIVAWFVPEDYYLNFEVSGGTDAKHVTFAYLGEASDMSIAEQRTLIGVVAEVVARHHSMRGVIGGTQVFEHDPKDVWVANVLIEGLTAFRADLVTSLTQAGIKVDDTYEFTPHMTLAEIEKGTEPPAVDFAPTEVYVGRVTVAIAGLNFDLELPQTSEETRMEWDKNPLVEWNEQVRSPFVPIVKSIEEKRFTLAPVYIPMRKDAHNDWATADDLQEALWAFNRGERHIAVQHNKSLHGGECVELMSIPWEHEVDMPNGDGTFTKTAFPAGTPWMGVIWDEDTWPLVKAGKIRGYSIGGHASMLDVDLPE